MKKYAVYLMGLLYLIAGFNHFWNSDFYIKMMMGFPFPKQLNILSGFAEIILGIGACITPLRKIAAWGIILLLIAVFPANINMAVQWREWGDSIIPFLLRLPVQVLLIWWAAQYARADSKE